MITAAQIQQLCSIDDAGDGDALERAVRLLAQTAATIVFHDGIELPEGIHTYTGDTLNLLTDNRGHPSEAASNAVHELGHWHVAPPRWRTVANYGLSNGFDEAAATEASEQRPFEQRISCEESWASALGIAIEAAYGADWSYTAMNHGWFDTPCDTHRGAFDDHDTIPPYECSNCWARLHRSTAHAYNVAVRHQRSLERQAGATARGAAA